jgi:hypothetical protein
VLMNAWPSASMRSTDARAATAFGIIPFTREPPIGQLIAAAGLKGAAQEPYISPGSAMCCFPLRPLQCHATVRLERRSRRMVGCTRHGLDLLALVLAGEDVVRAEEAGGVRTGPYEVIEPAPAGVPPTGWHAGREVGAPMRPI